MLKVGVFLLLVACGKRDAGPPPLAENVLARVGTEVITVEDFQHAMKLRPAEGTAARSALLDELILFRAQVQEARARGYDRDPEIVSAYERLLAAKVRGDFESSPEASAQITPEAIEEHYRAHAAEFAIPAKIRVAMIHVEAPASYRGEKRAERLARIEEARVLASGQPDQFARIAAEYSYDQATKFQGGDLGYLVEGMHGDTGLEPELVEAAFALTEPGQLSGIVATQAGFSFLKLIERQEPSTRPLATVRDGIRQRLQAGMRKLQEERFAESILAGKDIDVRRERLEAPSFTVIHEVLPDRPPIVPRGE